VAEVRDNTGIGKMEIGWNANRGTDACVETGF
jgi:hypothetical protein